MNFLKVSIARAAATSALLILACAPLAAPAQVAHAQALAPGVLAQALSFEAASRQLDETNRSVRLARRALDIASSEIRRADVAPNPTVSASLANPVRRQFRAGENDRSVRIEQLVERGNKRELRVATARIAERSVRLDLVDVIRQQRAALADAYFGLVAAQRLVRIADENAGAFTRLLDAAQRRLSAGDIASIDVSRLRVEASRAANDARAARAALDEARVSLALVLGIEQHAASLNATDDFPPLPVSGAPLGVPDAALIEAATMRRADAIAAQTRVEALVKARELALSQRTRDVTVGVQAESGSSTGATTLGLSLSIPLFVNNDFSGDVARAQADLEQAREELERVRGAIRADVDRSASQLASAGDRARRFTEASLPEARRAAEAIEFAFARGAANLNDLFDARRQFAAVRADAVAALADYAKALAAYREALATEEKQ